MLPVESIIAPLKTELKLTAGGILLFCDMTAFYFKTDRVEKNLCSIFVSVWSFYFGFHIWSVHVRYRVFSMYFVSILLMDLFFLGNKVAG